MIWYDYQSECWQDDDDPEWSYDMTPEGSQDGHLDQEFKTKEELYKWIGLTPDGKIPIYI